MKLPKIIRNSISAKVLLTNTAVLTVLFSVSVGYAGSATWQTNPTSGDWNTAANWTPGTVPEHRKATATFGNSSIADVSLSADIIIDSIVFNPGANTFTITPGGFQLGLAGAGIVNNSGVIQHFILPADVVGKPGSMDIREDATAGSGMIYHVDSSLSGSVGGFIGFRGMSSAGDSMFIVSGAPGGSGVGGRVQFQAHSTAAGGTFICEGGGSHSGAAAVTSFFAGASAGNATIIAEGSTYADGAGGQAFFSFHSTAADATLIGRGTQSGFAAGTIYFSSRATGERARVEVFGTGNLNIFFYDLAGLTIGSLEGDGNVFLGVKDLIVGTNNLNTRFDGVISGSGGVSKVGLGRLSLTNANTYTGGTTVSRGALLVSNVTGSATGTGPVTVSKGTFGGTGLVSGAATIGTATAAATLAPGGEAEPGTLSFLNTLTLNSLGSYKADLNSDSVTADQVIAVGITINSGATIIRADSGSAALPSGTVFTIISNTAATPIGGSFSNLADGATVTIGNNTYQADYHGGDGNDLTLTVVP